LRALADHRITNQQAADALHLSLRQVQRLKLRYEDGGARSLLHRARGRPSPRRLDDLVRERVAELLATTYVGFNDVHLTEKLREVEGLVVSRPTVRRLRRALGLAATRRRRGPQHRARRARRPAAGSLVQIDGSPFAWLEDRGPACTLLGAIDDATGTVLALHFRPAEDLHGYLTLFRALFTTYGLPVAFYGDRLNVFVRNDRHWTLAEELQGAQEPTHLGHLLRDLGVGYIAAHSPQAKGRIERLWQTLQDRLVSELRLQGVRTLAEANAFLPAFIADFNRRFAVAPADATPVWRHPPRDLAQQLGCRYARVVAHDNTVRLGPRWVQLPPAPHGRSRAQQRVDVRELVDGRLLVFHEGTLLVAQPSPGPDFVLRPRRAPGRARGPRPRPAASARAPQSPQDRRAAPTPLSTPSGKSAPPPGSTAPARARRPSADHPWKRAAKLHLLRNAQRTRG
jgi:transposase